MRNDFNNRVDNMMSSTKNIELQAAFGNVAR